jgi:hypothetical protein
MCSGNAILMHGVGGGVFVIVVNRGHTHVYLHSNYGHTANRGRPRFPDACKMLQIV